MALVAALRNTLVSEEKPLKYITIPISVPISCTAIDDENNTLNLE
jgi:hypothetical protein